MTSEYNSGSTNGQSYLRLADMSDVAYYGIPSDSATNTPLDSNVRPEEQLEPDPWIVDAFNRVMIIYMAETETDTYNIHTPCRTRHRWQR
jgi:hypothetical protein